MSQMKDAKKRYDEIPIPDELQERVQRAIEEREKERSKAEIIVRDTKRQRYHPGLRTGLATAAAVMVLFTGAVNTNTALAENLQQLPGIGSIARILTFRSYEKEEKDFKISVEIPSLEVIGADTQGLAEEVNKEIHALCQAYGNEAMERAMEYKKAFLETGGTEEEWAARSIKIRVWYEIKSQTGDYLSFAVMGSESWSSAYSEAHYYNLDLNKGKIVTLKEVLGEDYAEIADRSIREGIKEKEKELGIEFWGPEEGGYSGVTENTAFYMNEAGNPVVVFEKYAIAPGAAGMVEFEIKR